MNKQDKALIENALLELKQKMISAIKTALPGDKIIITAEIKLKWQEETEQLTNESKEESN